MNESFTTGFDFGLGAFLAGAIVTAGAFGAALIVRLCIDAYDERKARKGRKAREARRESERMALAAREDHEMLTVGSMTTGIMSTPTRQRTGAHRG